MASLRDYQHAGIIFRSNLYKNAPKYKFLFHVYFDINTQAYNRNLSTGDNYGLFVKSIKLPTYTFKTSTMNQYNRKRIVQTKINYEPVSIIFHDDNFSRVTKMWEAYYKYYYADGAQPQVRIGTGIASNDQNTTGAGGVTTTNSLSNYNNRTQYASSITGETNWGYLGEGATVGTKIPFFKNITVFGFFMDNYTAYTLINPIITNFQHDQYNYDEGNGTMNNTMTIDYETVVYNYGQLQGKNPSDVITGFGLVGSYDLTPKQTYTTNRRIG